jgi:RND superfamily putative drug exporter
VKATLTPDAPVAANPSAPDVVRMIATGLAAGIIIDAVLVRTLLVPALVALFGRWNWWMPDGLARLLRVTPAVRVSDVARA